MRVFYPQNIHGFQNGVPTMDGFGKPILDTMWKNGLNADNTAVLPHSLGGCGWAKLMEKIESLRDFMTYFFATPKTNKTGVEQVHEFLPTPYIELSGQQRERIKVIGSDNDRVINEPPGVLAGDLSVECIELIRAGHFMPQALSEDYDTMDLGKEWPDVRKKIGLPY